MAGLRYVVERRYIIRDQINYTQLETMYHTESDANNAVLRMNEAYALGVGDSDKVRQEIEAKVRKELEKEFEEKLKANERQHGYHGTEPRS